MRSSRRRNVLRRGLDTITARPARNGAKALRFGTAALTGVVAAVAASAAVSSRRESRDDA